MVVSLVIGQADPILIEFVITYQERIAGVAEARRTAELKLLRMAGGRRPPDGSRGDPLTTLLRGVRRL